MGFFRYCETIVVASVTSNLNATPNAKKKVSLGVLGSTICVETLKPFFEEDKQGYRLVQKASQRTQIARDMTRSWCQKKAILQRDPKLVSLVSPSNRHFQKIAVYKLCVPGSTVTRFWLFLDTIEHVYLVFGRFLTVFWAFLAWRFALFVTHRRHQDLNWLFFAFSFKTILGQRGGSGGKGRTEGNCPKLKTTKMVQ